MNIDEILKNYQEKGNKELIEYIEKVVEEKNQKGQWDKGINGQSNNLTTILLYEYATSISELTDGKVEANAVIKKLMDRMGVLRYGNWKSQDGEIEYDGVSVTNPEYRMDKGKGFGAQTTEYFDKNNKFQEAVIAYDDKVGNGINLDNINDIRHTFFHEWTHVMELDKVEDATKEDVVEIEGRKFKNYEIKSNGEAWGTGLSTIEYGKNAELYANEKIKDKDCNKRIMHNQIDEGCVELISQKVMENILGKKEAEKIFNDEKYKRYVPNVKVAQKIMDAIGEKQFIETFVTHSQQLVNELESITIDDRDALHYMSDFVNDETHQQLIPEYSNMTKLYNEVKQRKLSDEEIKHFIETDPRCQNAIQNSDKIFSSLSDKLKLVFQKSNAKINVENVTRNAIINGVATEDINKVDNREKSKDINKSENIEKSEV